MFKKATSILLTVCMIVSLLAGMMTANAQDADGKSDFSSVFRSEIYINENKDAGLDGKVSVSLDLTGMSGTLYLPGSADTDMLFLSWDDAALKVSRNGVSYASGTAPIAPAGESISYKLAKGYAVAYVTFKTVQGSSDVSAMFFNIDESHGTIKAMNSDTTHETYCYGNVELDGESYYMGMKGRGNSTWVLPNTNIFLPKLPYNVTIFKGDDFDKKKSVSLIDGVKAKKWSLLANYLDASLMRNKIAFDLADQLGIGLGAKFVDVWMNGEYLGNYILTPKSDYNAPDGGYFLENDNYGSADDPQFEIPGIFAFGKDIIDDDGYYNRISVKDIGDDAADAGCDADYIEAHFVEAWNTLLDYDSEDYQKYFDLDSWAKMYLMYEISKTYDCFAGSLLMHRDGLTENDKIIAGPVWDYDQSFGRTLHKFFAGVGIPNQVFASGWYVDSIGLAAMDKPVSILQELGKHESFMQRMSEIYNEYKWAFEDTADNVSRQQTVLAASAAMDNDKYGANHICTDYVVLSELFGAGKYDLNYKITTGWDDYVYNLREYCAKRVAWMSDHLYAEAPVGTIGGNTSVENGCSVVLKAELSAGMTLNSYQWQSSADGKSWTDIEGANGNELRFTAENALDGMQYRCVVKNAGVNIITQHTGVVKASAQTVLEPVKLDVTGHSHSYVDGFCVCGAKDPDASFGVRNEAVSLQNGELTLVLNGNEMGKFVFAASGKGWTICNEDGKYLALDGKELVLSDSPFVWSFDNGVFSATVKTSYTALGRWLGITHNTKVCLTLSGGELSAASKGAQASFLAEREYVMKN